MTPTPPTPLPLTTADKEALLKAGYKYLEFNYPILRNCIISAEMGGEVFIIDCPDKLVPKVEILIRQVLLDKVAFVFGIEVISFYSSCKWVYDYERVIHYDTDMVATFDRPTVNESRSTTSQQAVDKLPLSRIAELLGTDERSLRSFMEQQNIEIPVYQVNGEDALGIRAAKKLMSAWNAYATENMLGSVFTSPTPTPTPTPAPTSRNIPTVTPDIAPVESSDIVDESGENGDNAEGIPRRMRFNSEFNVTVNSKYKHLYEQLFAHIKPSQRPGWVKAIATQAPASAGFLRKLKGELKVLGDRAEKAYDAILAYAKQEAEEGLN